MEQIDLSELTIKVEKRNNFLLNVNIILAFIFITAGSFLLTEEDPLTVELDPKEGDISFCFNGEFVFTRLVSSTIPLQVNVREIYIPVDKPNEQFTAGTLNYPVTVGNRLKIHFPKTVPKFVPNGTYWYVPEAFYNVNALKPIVKRLPAQLVEVNCNKVVQR